MKLIASPTSPYARKVRMVLAEKNIPFELIIDIPWNADTDVPKFNPLGKIPVLVLEGGDTLYDSRVIVEYLEDVKPWPLLIPVDTQDRKRSGHHGNICGGNLVCRRSLYAGRYRCRLYAGLSVPALPGNKMA